MSAIGDKVRRARESKVESGGFRFTIRRPTDAEAYSLGESTPVEILSRFVVGWNLTELDLYPGGTGMEVGFDPDAFAEWVADRPEIMGELTAAIVAAYKAHAEKREGAEKN